MKVLRSSPLYSVPPLTLVRIVWDNSQTACLISKCASSGSNLSFQPPSLFYSLHFNFVKLPGWQSSGVDQCSWREGWGLVLGLCILIRLHTYRDLPVHLDKKCSRLSLGQDERCILGCHARGSLWAEHAWALQSLSVMWLIWSALCCLKAQRKCTGAGGDGSVMLCKFYGDVSEALSHCLRPTGATYGRPLCARI